MLDTQTIERHTLSVLVDDEPGVLARVVGLFSGRGYNIESLTVSVVDKKKKTSRILIITKTPRLMYMRRLSRLPCLKLFFKSFIIMFNKNVDYFFSNI